jgi:hypothetical protein
VLRYLRKYQFTVVVGMAKEEKTKKKCCKKFEKKGKSCKNCPGPAQDKEKDKTEKKKKKKKS